MTPAFIRRVGKNRVVQVSRTMYCLVPTATVKLFWEGVTSPSRQCHDYVDGYHGGLTRMRTVAVFLLAESSGSSLHRRFVRNILTIFQRSCHRWCAEFLEPFIWFQTRTGYKLHLPILRMDRGYSSPAQALLRIIQSVREYSLLLLPTRSTHCQLRLVLLASSRSSPKKYPSPTPHTIPRS